MKYKIFNSKKGIGIDDAIPVMVVIFVVAIMFMLFKFSEHSKEKDFISLKYGFYEKSPLKYQVAESVIPVKNGETLKITLYFAKGNPGAINSPIDRQ